MKKNEVLQKNIQNDTKGPSLNEEEKNHGFKIGRHLKKVVYIAGITGMGLFLNSCMAGYTANEPAYVEYARPARPSEMHVWIDGDWNWSSQSHGYVQHTGSWERQRPGHSYVSGHWQTSPRGRSWSKGHWQKEGHRERNRR
jgi:hypothetical protein